MGSVIMIMREIGPKQPVQMVLGENNEMVQLKLCHENQSSGRSLRLGDGQHLFCKYLIYNDFRARVSIMGLGRGTGSVSKSVRYFDCEVRIAS